MTDCHYSFQSPFAGLVRASDTYQGSRYQGADLQATGDLGQMD